MSQSLLTVIAAAAALAAVSAILTSIVRTAKINRKVSYMLDALEDGETSFRFRHGDIFNRRLNRTLNRLRDIFDKETRLIRETEQYYARILDNVATGVIVAEVDSERIVYSNKVARDLLGFSSITTLRQLKTLDTSVYEAFSTVEQDSPKKAAFYSENSHRKISVSATFDHIGPLQVKIIAFNDISSAIEDAESASWTRLIRVLTHEIMNTVSPIASLSEALKEMDGKELQDGLDTIASSSRSLIRFVESYRSLTRMATPVKKAILVRDLFAKIVNLGENFARGKGVHIRTVEKAEDILLYADEGQISQILINLVKNAVQAGATSVVLSAGIDARESVVIDAENNGKPISPDAREEIFVPFFTTKSDGTGIGLSLSRQIMRLHGGTLNLSKSDAESTVFTLTFR